ncbi:Membrane protein involved in the export of O-antigen and teichoic acid [Geosporobacter subterraneus DSM 17957]|uniref:Membrane protein involved in the export of O-antigen and teichoic acid n=1 Tax=Geosporobacter subterraneus DSM 17957 TaxID=1121919 RepID=A0A1M6D849_9FIRM|nr:lipopolysaccharide biosynthesis protein [Geosporobacter subterraneus]SHI69379.1 Membrane protein involved in the export of O-antigen and teichoic acid [Geosporobacter subterraneus DSM 17957]
MASINQMLKNVAKDTVYYTAAKVVAGLMGILSVKLFTSLFAPDVFGDYSIVSTTVNMLLMIVFGWLFHSAIRFSQEYQAVEEKKKFYSTLFLCSAAVSVLTVFIGGFLLFFLQNSIDKGLTILILGGILFLGTQSNALILFNLLRAERMSRLYSLLTIGYSVLKLAVIYVMARALGFGADSIFWSGALLDVAVITAMAYKLQIWKYFDKDSFAPQLLRRFFSYGSPLIGVSITTWILSASDKYVIKIYRTSAEVGIYSISYSLVAAGFTLVNTSLMLGLYPIILKTWKEHGKKGTEELMGKILRYYLIMTIPAFVGLSVLALPALTVLSSPDYISGYTVIPWVALGLLFQGLTEYVTKVWELQENTKTIFYLMIVAAIVNILLNIVMVPYYGFYAAAITTAASYLIYLILALGLSHKIFAWKISLKSMGRIAIASFMMAGVLQVFLQWIHRSTLHLILGILFGVVVYFIALILVGELKDEIVQIQGVLKRRRNEYEDY